MRERLNEILAHHTGQPMERIQDDTDRDYIMGPTRRRSTVSSTMSSASAA